MEAVAGVSIPVAKLGGKKLLETGYAASGQIIKTGVQFKTEEVETLFAKCLTNGFSQMEKAQEVKKDSESSNEIDGSHDTTVISGLIAQLFAIQSSGKTNAMEGCLPESQTVMPSCLLAGEGGAADIAVQLAAIENGALTAAQLAEIENGAAIAVQLAAIENGAAIAAQLAETENGALAAAQLAEIDNGAVTAVQLAEKEDSAAAAAQLAEKLNGTVNGLPNVEDLSETITVMQNNEKTDYDSSIGQVMDSAEVITAASYEVIRRDVVTGEQIIRSRQPKQAIEEIGGQKRSQIVKSDLTDNIVKAMKAEGGDGKAGQTFGDLLSEKEKPASAGLAKENNAAGALMTANSTIKDGGNTEKSQAVEKAINRFLNDFRSVETGKSEIQIVLEPESLGTLTISVSHTDTGISAKIKSEDREICALISNQIEKLIHSIESKGVTVENIDVFFSGTEQNLSFANSFSGRQEQPAGYTDRSRGKTEAVDSSDFFDQWQVTASVGNETNGTIEYRI